MPILTVDQAENVVAAWLTGRQPVGGRESPAGPLFPNGDYAEADITLAEARCTPTSACTRGCVTSWSVLCC